jgi:hypothetical protein
MTRWITTLTDQARGVPTLAAAERALTHVLSPGDDQDLKHAVSYDEAMGGPTASDSALEVTPDDVMATHKLPDK